MEQGRVFVWQFFDELEGSRRVLQATRADG